MFISCLFLWTKKVPRVCSNLTYAAARVCQLGIYAKWEFPSTSILELIFSNRKPNSFKASKSSYFMVKKINKRVSRFPYYLYAKQFFIHLVSCIDYNMFSVYKLSIWIIGNPCTFYLFRFSIWETCFSLQDLLILKGFCMQMHAYYTVCFTPDTIASWRSWNIGDKRVPGYKWHNISGRNKCSFAGS